MEIKNPLVVYLPDTRGVRQSRFGRGNLKIGPTVYTYSKLPGHPAKLALGMDPETDGYSFNHGTCPGATEECQRICYARRVVEEKDVVNHMWVTNGIFNDDVPPLPEDARLVRVHVSGDFDTVAYIANWYHRLAERPDVTCWAYTRSWRVPELLAALERLRALPNVQLFASMDKSTPELPPSEPYCSCHPMVGTATQGITHAHDCVLNLPDWKPWRRAWIDGDPRAGEVLAVRAHTEVAETIAGFALIRTEDDIKNLICPEETKAVKNCEECGFCFAGLRNDVIFLEH